MPLNSNPLSLLFPLDENEWAEDPTDDRREPEQCQGNNMEHRKLRSVQDGQLLLRPENMNIYLGQKLKSNGTKPKNLSRNFIFIKIINTLKIFLQGQEKKQKWNHQKPKFITRSNIKLLCCPHHGFGLI
ncbi:hypothetical protein OIU74_010346 [Salix koriyanagi]|uniref:Uncharacterized protein n=1 Tax=Salix koriyanagi TaxID=2511006 RepID=A0A9Q0QMD8_9ROSI|nr:hypothetical protein OIU74_010346 [Salix koriyanagi]